MDAATPSPELTAVTAAVAEALRAGSTVGEVLAAVSAAIDNAQQPGAIATPASPTPHTSSPVTPDWAEHGETMSVRAAAMLLGVNASTVSALVDRGTLSRSNDGRLDTESVRHWAERTADGIGGSTVARMLDLSRTHVYRLLREGALEPALAPNGREAFSRKSVEAYLAERGNPPAATAPHN